MDVWQLTQSRGGRQVKLAREAEPSGARSRMVNGGGGRAIAVLSGMRPGPCQARGTAPASLAQLQHQAGASPDSPDARRVHKPLPASCSSVRRDRRRTPNAPPIRRGTRGRPCHRRAETLRGL